jgi:hypothetical protein
MSETPSERDPERVERFRAVVERTIHAQTCRAQAHKPGTQTQCRFPTAEAERFLDEAEAALPNREAAPEGLNDAYRERNAVVAALIRTNGWPCWLADAPDAAGWVIVYAETPRGQVSWHVGPDDFDLFDGFGTVAPVGWDGHTTEEKYGRLAALATPPGDPVTKEG